jgi:hypothetical protein
MKKIIIICLSVILIGVLVVFGINKFSTGSDTTSAIKTSASVSNLPSTDSNSSSTNSNSSSSASNESANTGKSSSDSSKATPGGKANITIGSVSGAIGSTVIVPISVTSIPEKGIGSCNFSIKYDTQILEAIEVTPGKLIGKNTNNFDHLIFADKGLISFLYTCSNDGKDAITKSGEFINIKFKIKDTAQTGFTQLIKQKGGAFGDTSLNKIDATFKDSEITITDKKK